MLNRQIKYIDQINIRFDRKFINSLSLLSKRKIEPIIINQDDEEIIIGIKCPVIMDEETFDDDKKIIESDILKAFADLLNSEICNRKRKDDDNKKYILKYSPIPCPLCGSEKTIGHGRRKTNIGLKEKRYCKECGKYFTVELENSIWKKKISGEVIKDAIELSKQFTLRETVHKIKEKYNVRISHSSISIWRKNPKLLEKLDIQY